MKNNIVKTMEIYESPSKERNHEKFGHIENQCICCMKPIKNIDKAKWIHTTTDWVAVNVKEDDLPINMESQGFFNVGPSCSKKFPKEFLFEFNF